MSLPTLSKISSKPYRCSECGHEEHQSTNHYGDIYVRCGKCSWKSPMNPTKVYVCLAVVPEGMDVPAKWTIAKLGDVAKV